MATSRNMIDLSDSQLAEYFQVKSGGDPGYAIACALMRLAHAQEETWRALRALGNADASTPMGAIEALGLVIKESAADLAAAISDLVPE